MTEKFSVRKSLERAVAGATGFGMFAVSALPSMAFTQADALNLQNRLNAQAQYSSIEQGGNLLSVADEMNMYAGSSSYGPMENVANSTVGVDFNGSFGIGKDYLSFDLVSEQVKSPTQFVGVNLPIFTYNVDKGNRGLVAAYGTNDNGEFEKYSNNMTNGQKWAVGLSAAGLAVIGAAAFGGSSGSSNKTTAVGPAPTPVEEPTPEEPPINGW